MSNVAKSVYYFSFYLLLAGLGLFLFPNQIIALLGIPPTNEVWVHLVGALTFILGVFFYYMAKQDSRPFFFISMSGRGIFSLSIISLVLFYKAPAALLLFAAVDVCGLVWTAINYKKRASEFT
jgi:predicted membrane channel-forming protein YqfA (hemolysin III family)